MTKRTEAPSVAATTEPIPPQESAEVVEQRVLEWLARYRVYPIAARRAHLEGTVQVRATLMPDGRITNRQVEHSSGHSILDRSALELLERASPVPQSVGGMLSREIELRLPIVYHMSV